jgi:Na+/glutamate symporter
LLHRVAFTPDVNDDSLISTRPVPAGINVGVSVPKINVAGGGSVSIEGGFGISFGTVVCLALDASIVSVAATAFASATRVAILSGVIVGEVVETKDAKSQARTPTRSTGNHRQIARLFIFSHLSSPLYAVGMCVFGDVHQVSL